MAEAVDVRLARKTIVIHRYLNLNFTVILTFHPLDEGRSFPQSFIFQTTSSIMHWPIRPSLNPPGAYMYIIYILIKVPFLPFLGSYNNKLFLKENKDWVPPTLFGIFGTLYLIMWWIMQWDGKNIVYRLPLRSDVRYKIMSYIINTNVMYSK